MSEGPKGGPDPLAAAGALLHAENSAFARSHPGDRVDRQPVHTVYGGGHLFRSDTAPKLGAVALRALDEYAPDAQSLAEAVGLADRGVASAVYARVREKLAREPVEDYRIDFEDGYGARPDEEEDGHARAAAREVARALAARTLSSSFGIRVKPMTEEWLARGARTLELFLVTMVEEAGTLPDGFVITLPKITIPRQAEYFARLLSRQESWLGLPDGSLRFEIMVETPQLIVDAAGRCPLPSVLEAGAGRITAAHFGTYDYSAACGISAAHQRMRHEACQFALQTMRAALAGSGVWLSDGSTTTLPVPIHRGDAGTLTAAQAAENRASVHEAWRMHYEDVRHSLANGYYQGWDLHPAQLPTRYAALFAFFLEGLESATGRLRAFLEHAARATLVGSTFDDAATGQGLLNYFLRAINSGAISGDEAAARTGLSAAELAERSFARILERRRSAAPAR